MKKRKKLAEEGEGASRSTSKRKRLFIELVSLLTLALAIFIVISLFSYNSFDPSWSQVSSEEGRIHNYGGKVGAYLADSLLVLFGLSAFLIPILVCFWFIRVIRQATWSRWLLSLHARCKR